MNLPKFQQAAGLSAGLAARWFPHIDAAMKEIGITAPIDHAMFIAQSFSRLVESMNYSVAGLADFVRFGRLTRDQANALGRRSFEKVLPLERQRAIANHVYSKRLGNNASGDGWKYRGRGLIQITGLANYRDCGSAMELDLVTSPELLEQDRNTARSAAWFYVTCGCLLYSRDLERITQIVNGGQNGIDDRNERYKRARRAL